MSLFINGMDMPKHEIVDNAVANMFGSKQFTIFEIPTPHGRLIDADALINDLQSLRKLFPRTGMDYIGGVISLVQNTPAIIEAED